jgi:glycosyltransferase involved in cell wall biosynthesis
VTRVVIGLALYEGGEHMREAIETLIAQTYTDFAIVACDDSISDEPGDYVRQVAGRDPRFHYARNPSRLGMTGNWRRCFEVGRELHPEAVYFAWASDHDVWHPRWLEALVAELDAHPEAVLAYPMNVRIDAHDAPILTSWRFDTAGQGDIAQRLALAAHGMFAGDMVYGLFRVDAQERAGVFRSVLLPDRLLLSELAVHGEFRQVPEVLWHRRFSGIASISRQRASFWPCGTPLVGYAPWWLLHPAVLAYDLVILGRGRPKLGRCASVPVVAGFVVVDLRFEVLRKLRRFHGRFGKRIARPRRIAGRAVARAAKRGFGPAVRVQRAHKGVNGVLVQLRGRHNPTESAPAERVGS